LDFVLGEINSSTLNENNRNNMEEMIEWMKDKGYDIRVKAHVTVFEENYKNIEDLTEDVKELEIKEGKKIKKEESIYDIIKTGMSMSKVKANGEV